MKPIINSLTPSAIRAEHSEMDRLRLENSNLTSQLDSLRAELARRDGVEKELREKLFQAERRAAIWMSLVHGLPTDVNNQFREAAKRYDERMASLRSRIGELEAENGVLKMGFKPG